MSEQTIAERDAQRADGWYWVRERGDPNWRVGRWHSLMALWSLDGAFTNSRYLDAISYRPLEPLHDGPIVPLPATAPTRG